MRKSRQWVTVVVTVLFCLFFLEYCDDGRVLKRMPKDGSLSYGEVVYVENDGRCDNEQVVKVTGGKRSRQISRKYECVYGPD